MSSEFKVLENTGKTSELSLSFSTSCGPNGKQILQLTQGFGSLIGPDEPGYVQLSVQDTYRVVVVLVEWLKYQTEKRASLLSEEIKKNKELQKTIFQDAVNCQHFISDLKVLEIPVRLLS